MTQASICQLLIIDGNNLAHYIYPDIAPGHKMAFFESQRLIEHLNNYARQNNEIVRIELCLDRSPGEFGEVNGNLRVMWATYPQNGDDLLTGRFWFHHFSRRPCLVISNDNAILEEVAQAAGASLRSCIIGLI